MYNMIFQPNSNWVEGSGADTSGYAATVIDSSKPAILIVEVSDRAGNLTTITTGYQTHYAGIEPPLRNLGTWTLEKPAQTACDTIYNLGEMPYNFDELHLLYGNVGFSILDSAGGPLDLSPIPPGGRRLIQILFEALTTTTAVDSIVFGTACEMNTIAVIGNGGGADFSVSNQTWPNEPLPAPASGYQKTVTISNLSSRAITIDSAWWSDTVHFKAVTAFPLSVYSFPTISSFTIAYFPDSNSVLTPDRTRGSWFSAQVFSSGGETPRTDLLTGTAAAPLSVSDANNAATAITILPTEGGRSLEIQPSADLTGPITLELTNVLGISVMHSTFGAGTQHVHASALPYGVYFYHITAGQTSQSGKVILGQ